jgi:hypothetical protein
MGRSTIHSAKPGSPLAFLFGALGPCGVKRMPHDWDDWEKWRKRHRHGRPDWSRPGRGKARSERSEVRDDVRHALHEAHDEVREGLRMAREEILEQAWGEREEPMSNTIDVLVGRLRRKLDRKGQPSRIETLRGMGYRLR